MKKVEYISRKVLDRYFDRFTHKLVRINQRIMELEAAWNRNALAIMDLQAGKPADIRIGTDSEQE